MSAQVVPVGAFDAERVRRDFPALHQSVHGQPLVYLDNAATTHKPAVVIAALEQGYARDNANVHRGVHVLSQRATDVYEKARVSAQRLINAERDAECVFVRGTTEGINLVANTWGVDNLGPGDEVLVSGLEHHSNIVPWQLLSQRTGCVLKVARLDATGDVTLDSVKAQLSDRTKLVSMAHISNALGTVLPIKAIAALAHERGALMCVDGAQAVAHTRVDVQDLDVDFYTFSGHKIFAPTGTGVLWGRYELLANMRPWQGGGDMIETVTFEGSTWAAPPARFEAGTPHFVGAAGLGAALEYFMALDLDAMFAYEDELLEYGTELLNGLGGVRIIGTAPNKASVLSFVVEGVHPHDVGMFLDRLGIAVRVGHHCAMPVMQHFKVVATSRASLSMYNTRADLDALAAGLVQLKEFFGV